MIIAQSCGYWLILKSVKFKCFNNKLYRIDLKRVVLTFLKYNPYWKIMRLDEKCYII